MKWPKTKSLATRLAWRLCVLQVAILLLGMAVLTMRLFGANPTYIDPRVGTTLATSVLIDGDELTLASNPEVTDFLRDQPNLWFVATDGRGRFLTRGHVPDMYRDISNRLANLDASEIHTDSSSGALGMAIVVQDREGVRIRLMAGGAPRSDAKGFFFLLVRYLSPMFVFPLVLLTIIAVPLVILRSTAGVRTIAAQAAVIDIARGEAVLEGAGVPREIQPLVGAFNEALHRLRADHIARDRFLIDAAHELRMPIAILETRMGGMADSALKTRLLTDLARLSNVAEQLLDLQRLGHPDLELVAVDLVTLVRNVSSDIAPLAVAAGYELSVEVPPSGSVIVLGHAMSLSRVVTNLIQNAIIHAGGRGLIEITVLSTGGFEVRDAGPGLAVEEQSMVFEPFYRLDNATPGNGLGLYLAREIIDRHGGRIIASNAPLGGAVFVVELKSTKRSVSFAPVL